MKQYSPLRLLAVASGALCLTPFAFGESTKSISDGDWANLSIWNNGVPSSSVEAFIDSNITSSGNEGQVPSLGLLGGGPLSKLTMNSGSQIETTGGMSVNDGTLTINSGASLVQSASPSFGYIGRAAGTTAEMIVNGGSFSSVRPFFMGVNGFNNSTGTLTIDAGSFSTSDQMIFGGSGTNMTVAINGGTMSLEFVNFDQGNANADTGATRSIIVNGGTLILTTSNVVGSLQFTSGPDSPQEYVQFDAGLIVWSGVDSQSAFNAFKNTFDQWVDAGQITSTSKSNQELKNRLVYRDGGAGLGQSSVSIADGSWTDSIIWGNGVPSSWDTALVESHVISSGNEGQVSGLQLSNAGTLTMDSGSQIESLGGLNIRNGIVTMNEGASLLHDSSTNSPSIGTQNGANAEMIINGGDFSTNRPFFMGNNLFANATGRLTINSGSFSTTGQLLFGGSGSDMTVAVNGGTMSVAFVDFDHGDANAGTSATRSIIVNGGTLLLTAPNVAESLQFSSAPNSPQESLQLEAGRIVWSGVDSQSAFYAFENTFDQWVDAGRITSATMPNQELKNRLVYSADGAVLEPGSRPETTLYVAPDGNDSWSGFLENPNSGNSDGPLATLTGARDRIRTLRANGPLGAVEVLVRGGIYYESKTLVLAEQDSGEPGYPVTFKAYPGESPVISGGRRIGQPTLTADGRYEVTIPQAVNRQWTFRQLFIDDRRYTLARSPNEGYYFIQGIPPEPDGPYHGEPFWSSHNFTFAPGDLKNWDTLEFGDVSIRVYSLWEAMTVQLTSVDEAANTAFTFTHMLWGYDPSPTISPRGVSRRYLVENAPDALDAPGEWYLDRATGQLSILPFASEDLSVKTLVAPVTKHAITISGDADANRFVEYIHFEDIAFRHYAVPAFTGGINGGWRSQQAAFNIPACITITAGGNIEFRRCEVSRIGMHTMEFGRGCVANKVEQCHLYDLGGGGIVLGELKHADVYDPGEFGHTSDNIIYNNYIHDGGIIHNSAPGMVVGQSFNNTIQHNEIAFFNWSGVQLGWTWDETPTWTFNNRFEYNYIHDIGQNVSSDLGGIYVVGENIDTIVGNNVVHDVFCWLEDNGRGIYADQKTKGVTFRNNLVYNVGSSAFGVNIPREFTAINNIFALSFGESLFDLNNGTENARVTNNIFYCQYGVAFSSEKEFSDNWFSELDRNLYWRENDKPVLFPNRFLGKVGLSTWQTHGNSFLSGYDQNSLEADPMFKDPLIGDFSFRDPSNANAVGFVPVDWSLTGLQGDSEWVSLPEEFQRNTGYRVFYEDKPEYFFTPNLEDTLISNEFAFVEEDGETYGGMAVTRINIPYNGSLEVSASSTLLPDDWVVLPNNATKVSENGVHVEEVIRDVSPVDSFERRFYRLRLR